jgi:YgiT-type zinc finger domain-containing protein
MSAMATTGPAGKRGNALPVDACPACGTMMVERRGSLSLPVGGEEIAVPSAGHRRCPKCGEVVLNLREAQSLERRAKAAYQRKHPAGPAIDRRTHVQDAAKRLLGAHAKTFHRVAK